MSEFFTFLAAHSNGIFVFLLACVVVTALGQWVLWMFRRGRFAQTPSGQEGSGVYRELLLRIIYEFRHLLALVIVVLFTLALFIAIWPGMMKQDVTLIRDGLQAVAATLGGLIGSIIGYYFGESAASKGNSSGGAPPPPPPSPAVPESAAPPPGSGDLRIPPKPPQD